MTESMKTNVALNVDELEILIDAIESLLGDTFRVVETRVIIRAYTKLDKARNKLMKQIAKEEGM